MSINEFDAATEPHDVESLIEGPFGIENDRLATWALRKRAEAHKRAEDAAEVAAAEHDRINTWLAQEVARPQRDIEFFDRVLIDYGSRQRAEHDRKSISTPYGSLKSREMKARTAIEDRDAFIAWAVENAPELLVPTYKPAPGVLEQLDVTDDGVAVLRTTGEVVPGVVTAPAKINWTVS